MALDYDSSVFKDINNFLSKLPANDDAKFVTALTESAEYEYDWYPESDNYSEETLKDENDEKSSKLGISDLRKDPTYVKFFINGVGNIVLGIFPLLLLFLLNLYIYSKLTGRRKTFRNDVDSRGFLNNSIFANKETNNLLSFIFPFKFDE